jgi:heterodisulfide reductase subunit A2
LQLGQWFIEKHPKLDPVATMTDGVLVAGACQGPKDIPASVAQGAAAATRSYPSSARVRSKSKPPQPSSTKAVWAAKNALVCPYTAIEFLEDKGKAHVIEALCKGCGTCVGACLSKSLSLKHFTDEQLVAEMIGRCRR